MTDQTAQPDDAQRIPGDFVLHPAALAALALWAVNDHVLKSVWPGWWTGKLSDVASLAFAPLLLTGIWEVSASMVGARWRRSHVALWISAATLGSVMVGINLWDGWAWAYRHSLGHAQWVALSLVAAITGAPTPTSTPVELTMDPTDLITLPALLIAVWIHHRARGSRASG